MKDEKSTFAILKNGNEPIGTGFLVADKLVLTCAHVVVEAGAEPGKLVKVISTGDHKEYGARVLADCWRPDDNSFDRDIAYLELDELPPDYIKPLEMGDGVNLGRGIPFTTFGYRKAASSNGISIDGTITSVQPDTHYLQLESSKFRKGISGAPVMAHDQVVMGMIKESDDNIAFAIPTDILLSVNPGIGLIPVLGSYAPRVLICHDVIGGFPEIVLARIKAALVSRGWRIFEDAYRERQDEFWKPVTDEWIWQCDAVIVLSCQDSHRLSHVPFGQSIFNYRLLHHGGDFKAVNIVFSHNCDKVQLPEITENGGYTFSTCIVPKVAENSNGDQDLSKFVRDVLSKLGTGKRIGHELEGHLTTAWKAIPEDDRLDVTERVFFTGGKFFGERTELANVCARAMIEMSVLPGEKRVHLLEHYMHKIHTKFGSKMIEEKIILDCSFPFSWVDPKIAAKFLDVTAGLTKYKGVIWGARRKTYPMEAEKSFLRRVFCQKEPLIVEVSNLHGGRIEAFLEEVREGMRRDIFRGQDLDEDTMRTRITSYPKLGKYVYLSMAFDTMDDALLNVLFERWPGVIPFFHIGDNKGMKDFENELNNGDIGLFDLSIDLEIEEVAFRTLGKIISEIMP